ncbi:sporulation membrane protein YtaF [Paenibacillus endoradicis]|uniref:sporulation membrane protein YtaF n=1 Tax=Paenibacillus endoradicis TaxID=2972487 RepID=UPI00280AA608|nr:sporulation membrane protein YtaF [Paenibacillus endoradicis]
MLFVHFASMAILAVAVSLDSFGVGITYGLRKITIPFLSIIIISCFSGVVIGVSMQAGAWLTAYLSPTLANDVGASILVLIGLWALYQYFQSIKDQRAEKNQIVENHNEQESDRTEHNVINAVSLQTTATVFRVELKRLGLVIQILRTPQTADFDSSGTISSSEAIMLGIALSLDSLGAGIGAALLGLHPIMTPIIIAICSALFLIVGTKIGQKLAHIPIVKYFSGLPGLLLIILGISKFF